MDFLFSSNPAELDKLEQSLSHFRTDEKSLISSSTGEWGCLVWHGTPYPGFAPLETENSITLVLGGPLPRNNLSEIDCLTENSLTSSLYDHWNVQQDIDWMEDFVGHFLILTVSKITGEISAVTDCSSFIPLYSAQVEDELLSDLADVRLGSHSDALAASIFSSDEIHNDFDFVSISDFLKSKIVTFPHTLYKSIKQLHPGTAFVFSKNPSSGGYRVVSNNYWIPSEKNVGELSFKSTSEQLRKTLQHNIASIARLKGDAYLMMSAGQDSRVVASVLSATGKNTHAVTFLDSFNREASIAEKVCKKLDIPWRAVYRERSHYIDNIDSSMKLCESANFFIHAHINGFQKTLPKNSLLLGGNLVDSLFRGLKAKGFGKAGILWKVDKEDWAYPVGKGRILASERLQAEVAKRKVKFNKKLKNIRPNTWAEWHGVWPATMNTNTTSLHVNRRMYVSYEPFMDSRMMALSAKTLQRWKLNRKLFAKAMKPLFKKVKFIPHGEGFFPSFGLLVNGPLTILLIIKKKIENISTKFLNRQTTNQGPWQLFEDIAQTPEYKSKLSTARETAPSNIREFLLDCSVSDCPVDNMAILHLLIWSSDMTKLKQ